MHHGRGADELQSLADLVQVATIKQGLRFFLDRRDGRSSTAIADLAATLEAVAWHRVRVPPEHLDRIAALQRRLDVPRRALTETNRARGAVHLVIAAEQVKKREPLEFPLPPKTAALLERYRAEFRPLLAPAGSTALFPGRGGSAPARPPAPTKLPPGASPLPSRPAAAVGGGVS